jgi:hypothetical protein
MIFLFGIPEDVQPKRKFNPNILTEQEYFASDVRKLEAFQCPNCHEHTLFRGGVYIGCFACLNYFGESHIIEANKVI